MRLGPAPSETDDLEALAGIYAHTHNFLVPRIPFFRFRSELSRRLNLPGEIRRRTILCDDKAREIYNAAAGLYLKTVPEWRDRYFEIIAKVKPIISQIDPPQLWLVVNFPDDMKGKPTLPDFIEWFLGKVRAGKRPGLCAFEAFFNLVWDLHREVGARIHDLLAISNPDALPPTFPTSLSLLTTLHEEVNLFIIGQGQIVDLFRAARAGDGLPMSLLLERREAISLEHPPTGNIVNHLDTPAFGKGPYGEAGSLDYITRLEAEHGPWWVAAFEEQLLRDARILRNKVEAALNRVDTPADPWHGRVNLDEGTRMIQLDGVWENLGSPPAFAIVRELIHAGGSEIDTQALHRLPGCKGRIDVILSRNVPARVRACIKGRRGAGTYYFQLPPKTCA